MQDILHDRSKFHQFCPVPTHDRTNVLERQLKDQLKDQLLSLYKEGELSKQVYQRIRPTGSQRPKMCGLPRTHKQDVPWRLIISIIGSAQNELAKCMVGWGAETSSAAVLTILWLLWLRFQFRPEGMARTWACEKHCFIHLFFVIILYSRCDIVQRKLIDTNHLQYYLQYYLWNNIKATERNEQAI